MSSKLMMNQEGNNNCDPSDTTGTPDPEARAVLEVADNFMKYLGVQFGDSAEVDPDSRAKLEALLDVADKQLIDPEVLRRLTSSVSCALDEAAAALTRMRTEEPDNQSILVHSSMNELALRMKQHGRMLDSELFSSEEDESDINCHSDADLDEDGEDNVNEIDVEPRDEDEDEEEDEEDEKDDEDDDDSTQDQFGESCPIDSSLIEAYNLGDMDKVRKLIQESGNVNEVTEEGESLLSLACSSGYYELAQLLLAMNANVEDRGLKDTTPLMEAASAGHPQIVRLLLHHGADVSAQTSQGHTPLMYAAAGGHVEIVEMLLEAGANVEDHNENGHTALMEAASAGHVEVARVLVNHGASINTHSNEFKESALTLACYKGHLEMVRFLLEAGADQEHKTEEMHTALMEASMDGHVEVARLLLDSGAQVNMPADSFESPLTLAACGGHVELAVLLLERGANIEEVNDEGYTPLMEAAREGHEEMVALLISHGADINAQTEETQETALTLACCGGFLEVADLLLKHGADIEMGANTPLMEAAQEGHVDLVKYLIANRANVNAQTQSGDTALMYAAENGHVEVCEVLYEAGAQIEHEAEGGRTPLMKAARAGHLNTVQFLVDHGANVNKVTTNNDHTPLSLACAGGHLSVVEFLLKRGADPTHRLKDNSTMLIEAAKGGHAGVVQLLIDWPNSGLTASDLAAGASHLNLSATESLHAPQSMHPHTCEPAANSLPNALTSKPTVPKARRRSASSNKVLERSLSDSSTPSTLANASSCAVTNANNANNSMPLSLATTDSVVSTLGNFAAGIDTLKETERLEACISQMMKRTEMLNPSREEQILQKQQILEELQRVERELQQKAQTQLMLTVNAQQQQQQQHLLQSLLQASAGLPPNKSLTPSNSVSASTASSLSTYEALSNVLSTTVGGGGLSASTANHLDATAAANLSQQRSLSSSSTQIEAKDEGELEPEGKSKLMKCENRGGDHDQMEAESNNPVAVASASQVTTASGNMASRRMKKLQPNKRLTSSGSLLKNSALSTVSQSSPCAKANSDLTVPDVERMNYKNAELRNNSGPDAKKKAEGEQMGNFQEAHLENIARLAQNLASSVPHLSQEQAALLANQVKRQGIDPEIFKSMLASSCINITPDVINNSETSSNASRAQASAFSGNKGSQKTDAVPSQKDNDARNGDVSSSGASEHQVSEIPIEKSAQSATKPSKGKEKIAQTTRSVTAKKSEGFPFNLAEAGEKGLTIPQLIPQLTPEQLEALKSGLAALNLPSVVEGSGHQKGQSDSSSEARGQPSGKRRSSSSSIHLSDTNSCPPCGEGDGSSSCMRTDGDGSSTSNSSAPTGPSPAVISSLVTPPIFGGKPEFSTIFPSPAPSTTTNINNISFPALPPTNLDASCKMPSSNLSSVAGSCAPTLKPHLAPDFNFAMMRPQGTNNNQAAPPSSLVTKDVSSSTSSSGKRSSDALVEQSKPHLEGSHANTVRMAAGARPVTQTTTGVTASTKGSRIIKNKKVARRSEPLSRKEEREERTTSPPPWYNSSLDVDSQTDSNHDTALTLACAGGHEELVQLLLNRGADIEHRDKKGFTPLMLAATAGHATVVRTLIESGADMEAQSERTKDTALSLACSSGRYEVVEYLLQKGANKEHRNVSDYTPLSLAASGGYVNIIKLLLNHGTEINSRTGSKLGISPLMLAAMNGHTAAVKMLLDMGSDINAQIETNRNTALTLACFQGRAEVVSLLTERKANVEHRAKTGLTPLMEAASGGYVDVGRILIDKGADVNAAPVPSSRDTALTIAADKGHYRFVELLLDKGAAIDAKNKKGNSSLWLACNGGHLDVVQLLVSRGADIDSQDNRKVSCLMAAFRKGHVKVVKWMVKHVNQFPSDQEMTRYLALVGDKELLKKCQQCMEIIRQQKERQAAEANRYASILLEEIDAEKSKEEERRAAKKKKGKKKKEKENAKGKNATMGADSKASNGKGGKEAKGSKVPDSKEEPDSSSSESDSEIVEEEPFTMSILQQKHSNAASLASNARITKSPSKETAKNQKNQQQSSAAKTQQTSTAIKKDPSNSQVTSASSNNSETINSSTNKKSDKKKKEEPVQETVHQTGKKAAEEAKKANKDKTGNQTTEKQSSHHEKARVTSKDNSNKENTTNKKQQKQQQTEASKATNEKAIVDVPKESNTSTKKQPEKSSKEIASEGSQNSNKAPQKSLSINNTNLSNGAQNTFVTTTSNAQNGSGAAKKASPQIGEWKDVERSKKPRRVVVPANAISRVIGRGGCNINAVREYSGAHIEVEKQKGQGDRNVIIKGPTDAMKTAQTMIQELINEPDKDINEILQSLGLARRSSDDIIINTKTTKQATVVASSNRSGNAPPGVLKSSSTPSVTSNVTSGHATAQAQVAGTSSKTNVQPPAPTSSFSSTGSAWGVKIVVGSATSTNTSANTGKAALAPARNPIKSKTDSSLETHNTVNGGVSRGNTEARAAASNYGPQCVKTPYPNKQPFASLNTQATTNNNPQNQAMTSSSQSTKSVVNQPAAQYNLFAGANQGNVWGAKDNKPNFASVAAAGINPANTGPQPSVSSAQTTSLNVASNALEQENMVDMSKAPGYRGTFHHSPGASNPQNSSPASGNSGVNYGPIGPTRSAPCTPPLNASAMSHNSAPIRRSPPEMSMSKPESISTSSSYSASFNSPPTSIGTIGSKSPSISHNQPPRSQSSQQLGQNVGPRAGHQSGTSTTYASQTPIASIPGNATVSSPNHMNDNAVLSTLNPNAPDFSANRSHHNHVQSQLSHLQVQNGPSLMGANASAQGNSATSGNPPRVVHPQMAGEQLQLALLAISSNIQRRQLPGAANPASPFVPSMASGAGVDLTNVLGPGLQPLGNQANQSGNMMGVPPPVASNPAALSTPPNMQQFSLTQAAIGIYQQQLQQNQKIMPNHPGVVPNLSSHNNHMLAPNKTSSKDSSEINANDASTMSSTLHASPVSAMSGDERRLPRPIGTERKRPIGLNQGLNSTPGPEHMNLAQASAMWNMGEFNTAADLQNAEWIQADATGASNLNNFLSRHDFGLTADASMDQNVLNGRGFIPNSASMGGPEIPAQFMNGLPPLSLLDQQLGGMGNLASNYNLHPNAQDAAAAASWLNNFENLVTENGIHQSLPNNAAPVSKSNNWQTWSQS